MEHDYALIMAGGGGTRLWPMSRAHTPKQLLSLIEEQSMFSVSVERLAPLFPPERIYVVTNETYADALHAQTPQVPRENFIAEPEGRDSGPAALLGISVIVARDSQATVVLLTADHHISNKAAFRRVLDSACQIAKDGKIVTLGISPSIPSTAFGYIQRGEHLMTVDGFDVYQSLGFKEKPDLARAVQFIHSGDFSWNSGMFVWTAKRALAEFEKQQPMMAALMRQVQAAVDTPDYEQVLRETWTQVQKISIDYAVMERADDVVVIPIDIGWSDVGSWDALFDVLDLDESGNGYKGGAPDRIVIDTKNTLVYSDKLTVTIGIEDVVIVDTGDVLMVCHKDRTQDVKQVVNLLRDKQSHHYL